MVVVMFVLMLLLVVGERGRTSLVVLRMVLGGTHEVLAIDHQVGTVGHLPIALTSA